MRQIGQHFGRNLRKSLSWVLNFNDSVHLASVDRAARVRRRARRGLTASSVQGGGWQTFLYVNQVIQPPEASSDLWRSFEQDQFPVVFVTHNEIVREFARTIEKLKFIEIDGLVNDVVEAMEATTLNCNRSPLKLENYTRVTTNRRNHIPICLLYTSPSPRD